MAGNECPGAEEPTPDDKPNCATGRDIHHDEKQPEVEQGGSQVALKDKHQHSDDPHDKDGTEVFLLWPANSQELSSHHRQGVARCHEITGEKQRECDFANFSGLKGDKAKIDPQARTVDGDTNSGDERHHQQTDTDHHPHVAIALEYPVITDDNHHDNCHNHRNCRPHDLPVCL